MVYQPVERLRAYESIVSQIGKQIADGVLKPGDRLPSERDLAESFGVSRVVVREAVRHLESRGLIEVRHGSGTYVRDGYQPAVIQELTLLLEIEETSLVEMYVIRRPLEQIAVTAAATHASEDELAELEQIVIELRELLKGRIDSLDDYLAFSHKDLEFHLLIAEASGNKALRRLMSALLPLFITARTEILRRNTSSKPFITPRQMERVHQEHEDIFLALKNRDANGAEYFMHHHLQGSIDAWSNATDFMPQNSPE